MYTVVGPVKSRAFRVMWMLEELRQDYEVVPAAPASDEARQFNHLGKIPALVDGDAVLTLNNAAQPIRWIGHRRLSAWDFAANPKLRPVRIHADALEEGVALTREAFDFVAEKSAATGYLAGNQFSIADLPAAAILAPSV